MALRFDTTRYIPPAAGGVSTFTVNTWPANPYVGEAVRITTEGTGGHSLGGADSFGFTLVYHDVGEVGAAFEYLPEKDAETAYGRHVAHCYATSGSKTITTYSTVFDGADLEQETSVTVGDILTDATKIYYVDFNRSTSGMPAESATVTHILSHAQWLSLSSSTTTSDKLYVRFRGGATHTFLTTASWQQAASIVYVDSFGTGKATLLDASGVYNGWACMQPNGATAPRWIFSNLKAVSGYSPITGYATSGPMSLFSTNGTQDCAASAWRCEASGHNTMMVGSGANTFGYDYRLAYVDCYAYDYFDYGLGFTGSTYSVFARGCLVPQNPLAGLGDAKPNTNPEFADHNAIRVSRFYRGSVTQCDFRSRNGWSPLGSATFAIQPAVRVYFDANPVGSQFIYMMNDSLCRTMVEWGSATSSQSVLTPAQILIACNNHDFDRQGRQLVLGHAGGMFIYSNVAYMPKLSDAYTALTYSILFMRGDRGSNPATWQNPSYVGFNTFFSDMDGTVTNSNGVLEETSLQTNTSGGGAAVVTAEHNLLSAAGHTGSTGTAPTAFSRGDNFRPITGGAADSTTTSGPPAAFGAVKRTNPTNIGAHHTAGADVAVTAPANTVAPTIALNPYVANRVIVTDRGTWTNEGNILPEWRWMLNGSQSPASSFAHRTAFDSSAASGSVTCELTLTNRSGTRTTATSNTVSV